MSKRRNLRGAVIVLIAAAGMVAAAAGTANAATGAGSGAIRQAANHAVTPDSYAPFGF